MRIDEDLYRLASALGRAALQRNIRIVTAESCTGGLVASAITAVAGSSDWFERGFVTYSDASKVDALGVSPLTLARVGAVSEEVAIEMALGALRCGGALRSVAVTGIAGPSGGTPAKPVGTVCFAWAGPEGAQGCRSHLPGDRVGVRRESVRIALQGLLERLK